MTEMQGSGQVLRCPLGPPGQKMQNCDFGRTLFKGMSEATPSKTALGYVCSKECITFKSFIAKAELTARQLLRHGCRKGDVIALFAPNSIEWLVVLAASFRIGLIPAGISYVHKEEEVHRQLVLCGAKFLFTTWGRHHETALHSLTGTEAHTLFCIGKDNEMESGNGKEKRNGSINLLGHGKGNVNGFGNDKDYDNGFGNGYGTKNGMANGSGTEILYRKDNEKDIDDEKICENGTGIGLRNVNDYENRIGIGNDNEDGIGKGEVYENGFRVVDGDGNCSHVNCIELESFVKHIDALPELPDFDELQLKTQDVAMVMLSSGTTGLQKAILLSHLNLQAQFIIASDDKVKKVSDGQIVFAPFSHLGGGVMTLFALALGYSTHIMTRFQIEPYLTALSENKSESIAIVPAIALSLAKAPEVNKFDLSCLKEILCGTARLNSQVEQQLSTRFPGASVRQGYGLTETTAICICVPRKLPPGFARKKSGSIGVPLYNVEIKVVDPESGAILGPRQNGELLIRSPLVMNGYKEHEEISTSGVIDEGGWLHTGDMGYYDDDGFLWFVDRIKDMMKCASFQVSPSELESILLSHPDVADAAVFTLHAATSCDDLPAAWVVRKQGGMVTEKELDLHVSSVVASYKRLGGGITFVDNIPRTSNGKILRLKIQQLATAFATRAWSKTTDA